jgi:hypothetical protein
LCELIQSRLLGLAECWADADSLLFIQQLGVREIPASG